MVVVAYIRTIEQKDNLKVLEVNDTIDLSAYERRHEFVTARATIRKGCFGDVRGPFRTNRERVRQEGP